MGRGLGLLQTDASRLKSRTQSLTGVRRLANGGVRGGRRRGRTRTFDSNGCEEQHNEQESKRRAYCAGHLISLLRGTPHRVQRLYRLVCERL